jgi:hypothetical protein
MKAECTKGGDQKHVIGGSLSALGIIANPYKKRCNQEDMNQVYPYRRRSGK